MGDNLFYSFCIAVLNKKLYEKTGRMPIQQDLVVFKWNILPAYLLKSKLNRYHRVPCTTT